MSRSVAARLAVTVDFPTPPLPEATAMILPTLLVALSRLGGCCLGAPSLIATVTCASGKRSFNACSACMRIRAAKGSRALGKRSTTVTFPSAALTESTMPLSAMSRPVSGCAIRASTDLISLSMILCFFCVV